MRGGGGSGIPKPPKMCVFGLKNRIFRHKLTRRVLNVARGGVTGLLKLTFFLLLPFLKLCCSCLNFLSKWLNIFSEGNFKLQLNWGQTTAQKNPGRKIRSTSRFPSTPEWEATSEPLWWYHSWKSGCNGFFLKVSYLPLVSHVYCGCISMAWHCFITPPDCPVEICYNRGW